MTIPTQPQKNIWVAAGDGDLDRVRELVEQQSMSPNAPDPYTYTPMHAAASYGQLDVLEYLISRGGDVNITDGDGDTPLYTVENIETAQFLIDHGAIVDRRNAEGVSPVDHLSEDFGEIAAYIQMRALPVTSSALAPQLQQPSQHEQNIASENLTSALMASVQDIMQRAEAEGRDPEEELRQVVSRTVLEGVVTGYEMTTTQHGEDERGHSKDSPEGTAAKRPKTDDGSR